MIYHYRCWKPRVAALGAGLAVRFGLHASLVSQAEETSLSSPEHSISLQTDCICHQRILRIAEMLTYTCYIIPRLAFMSVALSLLETDRSSSTVWMHCSASKSRGLRVHEASREGPENAHPGVFTFRLGVRRRLESHGCDFTWPGSSRTVLFGSSGGACVISLIAMPASYVAFIIAPWLVTVMRRSM